MKILVVTTLYPNDPQPTLGIFLSNFLERLRPHVQRITVVAPSAYVPGLLQRTRAFAHARGIRPRQTWNGIEVIRPRYLGVRAANRMWTASRLFALPTVPVCLALHRRHRFDMVLGFGLGTASHAAQVAAADMGVPCASWAIGSDVHAIPWFSAENMSLTRHLARRATLTLTVSHHLCTELQRLCPSAGNLGTLYLGIDVKGFHSLQAKSALRARLGLIDGDTYIVSSGAVTLKKGIYEFYQAFAALAAARPNLRAIWVGGGPEQSQLEHAAAKDGLAHRFAVTGVVPRDQVLQYMQASDVMAFPSHGEGVPNVVLEAMGSNLPCISTTVGGIPEIIKPGVTGMLVPPGDAEAVRCTVERILDDPRSAAAMAARGRELVLRHFDGDACAVLFADLMSHLVRGRMPAAFPPAPEVPPGATPADCVAPEKGPLA